MKLAVLQYSIHVNCGWKARSMIREDTFWHGCDGDAGPVFGQCTPRSGSAYLLQVHSLMPDNMMLQAAASCRCVCLCPWFEAKIWGVWFVDMISFNWFVRLIAVTHLLSYLDKTNTTPSITPAVPDPAISTGKKRIAVTNERTAWHPHEVSGQSCPL